MFYIFIKYDRQLKQKKYFEKLYKGTKEEINIVKVHCIIMSLLLLFITFCYLQMEKSYRNAVKEKRQGGFPKTPLAQIN